MASRPDSNLNKDNKPPLSIEENMALYDRLVAGDPSARNEMIEGNIALAIHKASAYLRRAPQMSYYYDDMISAGLLGLVNAVDRMRKRGRIRAPKPTGYMSRSIEREISHVVDEANTIVVPYQDQAAARLKGTPIRMEKTVSDRSLFNKADAVYESERKASELLEELLDCCENDDERQIIQMRIDGYTDIEIGEAISMPNWQVGRVRERIEDELLRRQREYRRD